jgi:hypothetical protein
MRNEKKYCSYSVKPGRLEITGRGEYTFYAEFELRQSVKFQEEVL